MTNTFFESRSPSHQIPSNQQLKSQADNGFRQNVSGTDTDSANGVVKKFWAKVEERLPHECWPWTGGKFTQGYGAFKYPGHNPGYAHRFSFEMHFGPIPEGKVVRHTCDNPACVNPFHLELGTQKQNVRDAVKRGRWMTGARERHLESVKDWDRGEGGRWSPTPQVEDREMTEDEIRILESAQQYDDCGGLAAGPVDVPGGVIRSLTARGFLEKYKLPNRTQWPFVAWRITPQGRQALQPTP